MTVEEVPTWPADGVIRIEGRWDHYPDTRGPLHICPGCAHSERCVEYVGIGIVHVVKGASVCALEPNQPRKVEHVTRCEAFTPAKGRTVQTNLDRWCA